MCFHFKKYELDYLIELMVEHLELALQISGFILTLRQLLAQRVPVVSENNRPRDARTSRSASDPRQLRHPQDTGREALVGATQTIYTALHADILFLAQSRRAALRRNHSPAARDLPTHRQAPAYGRICDFCDEPLRVHWLRIVTEKDNEKKLDSEPSLIPDCSRVADLVDSVYRTIVKIGPTRIFERRPDFCVSSEQIRN